MVYMLIHRGSTNIPTYVTITVDKHPTDAFVYQATVREQGRVVAYYNDTLAERARRMAEQRYQPVEEEYPCGLFKGPEDY